jgi:hypothetical protein
MSKLRKITKEGKIWWKPNLKCQNLGKLQKKGKIGGNPI